MRIRIIADYYEKEKIIEISDKRFNELKESNRNYIGKMVYVKVDRPLGSKPIKEYPEFMYECNYGFVPNTISGDGEELDCYILGIDKPIKDFTGKCIAIIHRIYENDDKLIIVPESENYSIDEIEKLTYFCEKHHKSFVFK